MNFHVSKVQPKLIIVRFGYIIFLREVRGDFLNRQHENNSHICCVKNWESQIKHYQNYLKLERSLSPNSIQAYVRDVEKLAQFIEMKFEGLSPFSITSKHLQQFLQFISELGMSAFSQARILSGVKAFYKYLLFEDLITKDPTALLEGPKLGRKLPDTLSYDEKIVNMLESIDFIETRKVGATGLCWKSFIRLVLRDWS